MNKSPVHTACSIASVMRTGMSAVAPHAFAQSRTYPLAETPTP